MLRSIVIFLTLVYSCSAFKILLVFPFPGKSHTILGEGFVKHLLKAGHEVTYITPAPMKISSPNLRQIDVSSNFDAVRTDDLELGKLMTKEIDMKDQSVIFEMMIAATNATVLHESVQKLIHNTHEEFDAVIIEWMFNEVYSGFSSVFNCPMIWSSSMEPHTLVLSLIDDDTNPSYVPDCMTDDIPPFTFSQRVNKLWMFIVTKTTLWLNSNTQTSIYDKAFSAAVAKRGRTLPPLNEIKYNGSLMLGNSHVSSGLPIRLPQNYVPIGGYHIQEKAKPLPQNLQTIMDNAKHGVVYFSMGSVLKSRSLPDMLKKEILDMFGELKQTIIWKFEDHMQNLPKNVHIVQWAPQQSILAHSNCHLFITHGGLLSTTETLHFGVPIIGIPMFADQFNNVNKAVKKGFGLRVDLDLQIAVNLRAAIQDILDNPRYQQRVKELSVIYHDRVAPPGAELVHWVEHVVRTRGAPHLRSPALLLPWYQKMYLDLLAVILFIVFIIFKFIRHFLMSKKTEELKKKRS